MHSLLPAAMVVLATVIAPIASSAVPLCHASSSEAVVSSTVKPQVPIQPIVTYTPPTASIEASVTKIFGNNGGGFENLALRSNDNILATIAFPEPLLFYIDPLSIRPGVVLHNFTSSINTGGIAELARDMFYVSGEATANGSSSIVYSVDMRPFRILPNGTILTPPSIEEITGVPGALNGMTRIHRSDNFVLSSDSLLGGVWKINVETGKSEVIIKDPSMAGPPNKTEFAAFGINGLRVQNETLFYCNSGAQKFYQMPASRFSYSSLKISYLFLERLSYLMYSPTSSPFLAFRSKRSTMERQRERERERTCVCMFQLQRTSIG